MSDERRAEIEAVDALDALLDRIRWDLRDKGREPQSATWSGAVAQAQAVLDRLRDAQGDDEAARCGCNELLGGHRDECPKWGDPPAARSPQGEDAASTARLTNTVRGWMWPLYGEAARSPQGEDHEAGIEAFREVLFKWQPPLRDILDDTALDEAIAAYLARVSAPKADEKQEAR